VVVVKREYYIRNKKVIVDEITDVLAVKLKSRGWSEKAPEYWGQPATVPSLDKEMEAFTRAGWIFVHPPKVVTNMGWSDVANTHETSPGATYVGRVFRHSNGNIMIGTDRLTVRLKPEISEKEIESKLKNAGLEILRQLKFAPNLFEVRVSSDKDPLDMAVELHENPDFLYAEPQMIKHIPGRFKPNDPDYGLQWQWNNDGSNGGKVRADIDAENAWDYTRGEGIKVAVIDNGINVDHPDIKAAIVNGAGYFQDDKMGGSNFVLGIVGFPEGDHGTFCSGIAIARANNGFNGCGVANMADFIPVACLKDQVGPQVTLARAIAYAADPTNEVAAVEFGLTAADGADVISCSLGPDEANWEMESILKDAIDNATTNGRGGLGTPIFWAVCNCNSPVNTDEVCSYDRIIRVGRSTSNDSEDGSAFGPELDFLAPGVDVQSTKQEGFGSGSGTSYAAPCAAGIGALILAVNPNLTWYQVRQIMRDTCDKVGGVTYEANGHHDNYGFGRLNAASAVRRS
jgi:thermitase